MFSVLIRLDGQTKIVSLSVYPDKKVGKIEEGIYGQFLEHLYHSVNGGIWGEVVWNRSFEEMPPRPRQRDGEVPEEQKSSSVVLPRHWTITGNPEVKADTSQHLNSRHSLKIVSGSSGNGISQSNFFVLKGDILKGSLWMRGNAVEGMVIQLVDGKTVLARQVVAAPGNEWREFPVVLNPVSASNVATLQILTMGKTEVWIDQVSLMPESYRANGGYRTDLLKAITDLKPTSIRWPGGSFVNGYRWKEAIGPQEKRMDKGRAQWDEVDPLSFGIDEFVALCRKVGAEPVVVLFIGPRNQTEPDPKYIQDGIDLLEYCNGSSTSTWGKIRKANGHPEPYNIRYWEIDNEIYLTQMPPAVYLKVAQSFADALRKKDSSVTIIGCGGGGTSMNTDKEWQLRILEANIKSWNISSIHSYANYAGGGGGNKADTTIFYSGVESFEKHFADYRKRISQSTNPELKLYLSEWNYMSVDWRTGLYAAGILNTMERNSDIIVMACPALWLRHTTAPAWDNAFINFDNCSWFPAPNYVVMKLFRDHFGPNRISIEGDTDGLNIIASRSADNNKVYIKIVNPSGLPAEVSLSVENSFKVNNATLSLIAPGDLKSVNTMQMPSAVSVVDKKPDVKGNVIKLTLPRWSVGVISIND